MIRQWFKSLVIWLSLRSQRIAAKQAASAALYERPLKVCFRAGRVLKADHGTRLCKCR